MEYYKRSELGGNRISWTREDPYRTLGIGGEELYRRIKPGDLFLIKKDLPDVFETGVGAIIEVLEVNDKPEAKYDKWLRCNIYSDTLNWRAGKIKNKDLPWAWNFEFFGEFIKPIRREELEGDLKESRWERKDPYGVLGIGVPLPGLKVGDILSEEEVDSLLGKRIWNQSHWVVGKIERKGRNLYLMGAPFSTLINLYVIKEIRRDGIDSNYGFREIHITEENKNDFYNITKAYSEYWKLPDEDIYEGLQEWDRGDPYRSLRIGTPFPDLKEGDVLYGKKTNHYLVVSEIDRKKEGLNLIVAGFSFSPSIEVIEKVMKDRGRRIQWHHTTLKIKKEEEGDFLKISKYHG